MLAARYAVYHRTDGLKTIAKRVHGVFQLFASFDETHYPEDVHANSTVLKEAGVKSTATPAQQAVDGKVTEVFARTKPHLQQHIFNSIHSEIEMMRYMTMSQHKDLYLTTSMISLASCSQSEVMNIMMMCDMRIKWIDDSQFVPLEELRRTKQETEDVKENRTKGLIIVEIELVAVKSHKGPRIRISRCFRDAPCDL